MKKHIFISLTAILGIFVSSLSFAQTYTNLSFEEWLEKYDAWDQLEKEYAQEQNKDTPEVLLKRTQVHLNLNSPKEALELIEMTPAFADAALEARRLWLGGQAHRGLGDLSKAVLWFSQATHYLDVKAIRKQFTAEPGLNTVWKDVWLKLYWAYSANHTLSKSTQYDLLNRICQVGLTVWNDEYWNKANSILHPSVESKTPSPPALNEKGLPVVPLVTAVDRELVAKALASVSLEKFQQAHDIIGEIRQPAVNFFWNEILNSLENNSTPETLSPLIEENYLKATAFWQGNILAPHSADRDQWVLGNPSSAPWTKFRNNILSMSVEEARKAIDNELGSMLISEQTAALLNSFKLALSIANGDFISAATTWNTVQKSGLPLALQLSGVLLFKEDLNNILPENTADAFTIHPVLISLCGAAGHNLGGEHEADFWITAAQEQIPNLATQQYPLDKLLLLSYWQQIFDSKPTEALAKRAAFLFGGTSFGNEALLFLADASVKAKKLQLGAFYLNQMLPPTLSSKHKGTWLDIKTRLELESGRNAAALETFNEMHENDHDIPIMTRLRMALLYQQRQDFKAAQEQLLTMWDNRGEIPTALQAETLFWLGEGEQGMRNTEKALDYYLRLAWEYPQENIWALTAMYRASLIYEKRGKYETAKKLLATVAKRADRKEQREAAQARIAAIDNKVGKKKGSTQGSSLIYPF